MRIGQTSVVGLISRVLSSLLGAVASFVIARFLGADVLGQYALFLAVLHWMKVAGTNGVTSAVTKRISEDNDPGAFLIAGFVIQASLFVIFSLPLIVGLDLLNKYFEVSFSYVLVFLLFADLAFSYVTSVLNGQHKVHISALLNPVQRTLRSGIQIALILLAGMGLFGILLGYAVGGVLVTVLGLFFVTFEFEIPDRRHFRSLLSFVKYSWLGGLKGSVFSWVDTIVLSLFVSKTLIGVYELSWNIASLFVVFGGAIGQAIFPEISRLSSTENVDEIRDIATDALAFTGLFIVPGFFGALILGKRVLFVYGKEFTQGYVVLVVLVVARLFDTFQSQLSTLFNAIDRPDIGFRINAIIIVSNLALNFVLIATLGWIGAALATTFSAGLGLLYAYWKMVAVLNMGLPYGEILKQIVAACVMAIVVQQLTVQIQSRQIIPTLSLIFTGATVYILTLGAVWKRFRTAAFNNIGGWV